MDEAASERYHQVSWASQGSVFGFELADSCAVYSHRAAALF